MNHTKQLISGLIGCAVGIVIAVWWLTPKHTAAELGKAEREYLVQLQQQENQQDRAAMQGDCENSVIKATPSGRIAQCVNIKWSFPVWKNDGIAGNRTVAWEDVSDSLQDSQSAMTRKMEQRVKSLDYETLRSIGLLPPVNK